MYRHALSVLALLAAVPAMAGNVERASTVD